MTSFSTFLPFLLLLLTNECVQNCVFPDFMQSAKIDNVIQPWKTKTWWINVRSNQPQWKQREEIFVEGSNIWYQREEDHFTCEKKTRRVSVEVPSVGKCVTRTLLYNRTCVAHENNNKYRVVEFQPGHRSPVFLCMKFEKRSDTVVQTWEGREWPRHNPDLCDDQNDLQMTLDKWPWIATWKPKASSCPISGGFTFRTVSRLTNQDVCENDWRKTKLEIECHQGDGMEFIAPHGSSCNPFLSDGEYKRLYCWAGWERNQYIFMVAGGEGENPQYCVRFPKRMEGEFTVLLYFSVICPEGEHGQPPTGVDYYELHMEKIDPDVCEDENAEVCRKAAKHGKCERFHKNHAKYGPHCKKSCNLCDYPERTFHLQCPFDEVVHGHWVLYDNGRKENIKINRTVMQFSQFGTFTCQERTQDERKYKVISTFRNGCAAKYSCIDLHRRNNNILQYRIGRSYRHDEEFGEICQFRDSFYPVHGTYRSSAMKNLILTGSKLWESSCGMYGSTPFNGTYEDEVCSGYMSDWNEQICNYKGYLKLESDNCRVLYSSKQYQCLLFMKDETSLLDKYLITRSLDGRNEFNCWIFTSSPTLHSIFPNKEVIKMSTPQCSMSSRLNIHLYEERRPAASLQLFDDRHSKDCIAEVETPPVNDISQNLSDVGLTTTEEVSREHYSMKSNNGEVDPSLISVAPYDDGFSVTSTLSTNVMTICLCTVILLRYR